MDDLYYHTVNDPEKACCAKCKHIDWRGCLVSMADEFYHGWDGTSICKKWPDSNRMAISAFWKPCECYEEKDIKDHVFEMCDHILFALDEFNKEPESCNGKTRHEVIANVLSNYGETLIRHLNKDEDKFEYVRRRKEENANK